MADRFKTLEDTFNLQDSTINEEESDELTENAQPSIDDVKHALEHANDLEKQFRKLSTVDVHDKEMDALAKLAVDAHKDLQELGMNVEIRHAGEIFSSSSQMLKIAVDAKNNKVEKKLKLLRLQLIKMKLDLEYKDDENAVEGVATKFDRNELLNQLKQINQTDK